MRLFILIRLHNFFEEEETLVSNSGSSLCGIRAVNFSSFCHMLRKNDASLNHFCPMSFFLCLMIISISSSLWKGHSSAERGCLRGCWSTELAAARRGALGGDASFGRRCGGVRIINRTTSTGRRYATGCDDLSRDYADDLCATSRAVNQGELAVQIFFDGGLRVLF